MKQHYQEKLDKLFSKGNLWQHRTLRTIFDCNSTEWNKTSIAQKLNYLEIMLQTDYSISDWVNEYREYYLYEMANKEHVIESVDQSLEILIENAPPIFKSKLKY